MFRQATEQYAHLSAQQSAADDSNVTCTPAAGLPRAALSDIVGGDPEHNAGELRKLLEGTRGPYRDIVLLNAAAAFIVAGKAETLEEGVGLGAETIDSGKAKATLDKLIATSQAAA
jgi:anthranilate phosphoribosyltransferase